jgi:predicted acylesterase/phospholipase RssA
MLRTRRLGVWLGIVGLLAASCTPVRQFPAPNIPHSVHLIDAGRADDDPKSAPTEILPAVRSGASKVSHVLVLSSGGMNGAYQTGVLKGWTESGARPQFDVVTGVSVGSLIAVFAFLGPEYDATLERCFTSLQAGDIYHRRPLAALPWADSLADSGPLWHRIVAEMTPDVLAKVAEAHRAGRRLYVGTTNLDTARLVVWDVGAIAASDDPNKVDLIHNILLASCSIPGLLPPVPINIKIDGKPYTELHCDGGVSSSLFLQPSMLGLQPGAAPASGLSEGTVSVIIAGKLYPEAGPVQRRLFQVSESSLRRLFQSQMEGDLLRMYLLTLYAGMKFELTGIPQGFVEGGISMMLETKVMHQLFEVGRDFGRTGRSWQTRPPGIAPQEWQIPRRGVDLISRSSAGLLPPETPSSAPGEESPDPSARFRAWLRQKKAEMCNASPEPVSANAADAK